MIVPSLILIAIVALAMLEGVFEAFKDMIGIPDKWQLSHMARWSRGEGHFSRFLLYFTGPDSWRNKYRNRDPGQGPSFPGSTTWLVWLTDGWHLCKIAAIACSQLVSGLLFSLVYPGPAWQAVILAFLVLYAARSATFNPVYRLLHLNPFNMKSFLKSLFSNAWIGFAFFAALVIFGVFIGQFLNPFIDPSYSPETATTAFTYGDWVSVILPFVFILAYRAFLKWIRSEDKPEPAHDSPSELDYFEEN